MYCRSRPLRSCWVLISLANRPCEPVKIDSLHCELEQSFYVTHWPACRIRFLSQLMSQWLFNELYQSLCQFPSDPLCYAFQQPSQRFLTDALAYFGNSLYYPISPEIVDLSTPRLLALWELLNHCVKRLGIWFHFFEWHVYITRQVGGRNQGTQKSKQF